MRNALIIEDDPDASDILAALVRDRDFDPTQTESGEDGLRLARERRPDVVFLDLMLPDLDGYKICEALKLDRETNPIPVIMVTAMTTAEDRLRGFRVGADAYVCKPYAPGDIDAAVAAVDARRDRLQNARIEQAIEIDLSSELASLGSVNEVFGMLLAHTPLQEKEVTQLRSAFQEMGTNAIEWGNRYDLTKRVKIAFHIAKDRVEIVVEDEGGGFDPRNIPHASDGDDEDPTKHFAVREMLGLREGGFGILITRGMVDEVRYNDRGNQVTMVKRFFGR
ncbi:MAG TPA: ATP-binding protein [Planctomycetia bacterium]|nr:ATP-binding protein [Planctomycetia bacterium]